MIVVRNSTLSNRISPTSVGDICVVTTHFNFANFKAPVRNLFRFVAQCKKDKIPCYGIELYLNEPETKNLDNWIQIKGTNKNICFQKEALLSILIKKLPAHFTKVVVVDHDIFFERANWLEATSEALNTNDVVQPYSVAVWNGPDGKELFKKQSFFKSKELGHPGFAIAAKRKVFTELGFYPFCILGGGDIIFAASVSGRIEIVRKKLSTFYSSHNFTSWINKAKQFKYLCTYIDGFIYHEYHGSIKDRRYIQRNDIVKSIPFESLSIENGLVSINGSTNKILNYFISRNEDSAYLHNPVEIVYEPESISSVSCVVTCHSTYIRGLPEILKTIDNQTRQFNEKIIVLDGCDLRNVPKGWTKVNVNFGSPNPSRNAGLDLVTSKWCVFWDGDNFMPKEYCAEISKVNENVAFSYPSIKYIDEKKRSLKTLNVPAFNYWNLREHPFVDTSSIWKTSVLKEVKGFSCNQIKFDDYELALRITSLGYNAEKSKAFSQITQHKNRRSRTNNNSDALWTAYTFAVVTAFGSSDCNDILEWYKKAQLPPRAKIYWYCNINNKTLYNKLINSGVKAEIIDSGPPWDGDNHRDISRHEHVANMYDKILSSISEDLVMMIEDDNIGPIDGIRKLFNLLNPSDHSTNIAMVGGKYRSRSNPNCCCASFTAERWIAVKYDSVKDLTIPVKMMGGGFTLYNNSAIKKALPIKCTNDKRGLIGWDGNLGIKFHQHKYTSYLVGSVPVQHRCKEVIIEYEKGRIKSI